MVSSSFMNFLVCPPRAYPAVVTSAPAGGNGPLPGDLQGTRGLPPNSCSRLAPATVSSRSQREPLYKVSPGRGLPQERSEAYQEDLLTQSVQPSPPTVGSTVMAQPVMGV